MMVAGDGERVPYYAWGASLALHALIAGLALMVSAQVKPLVQEEIFRWDVALVTPLEEMRRAEEPTPAPAIRPAKPTQAQSVQAAELERETVMTRVAPPQSPELVHPVTAQPKLEEPPQPVQEVVAVQPQPAVEPQEIKKEEIKKEEAKEQVERQPEPVMHERREVPVAKDVAQPIEPVVTAQSYASPVPVASPPAPSTESRLEASAVPVGEPSVSPEGTAPEWRSLVPVGEGPAKTVTEPVAAPSAPAAAESTAAASAPVQAQPPAPPVAKAAQVRPATKADNAWLAESLGRRIKELTRYPSSARLNGWEGKVVLRVIIRADGHLSDVIVHRSSGHDVLDRAAMETIRLACPIHMKQTLSAPEVAVYVPIVYSLAG